MVSVYIGGPVDFNKKSYYDIVEGMIVDSIPVTLFRPGMAFKVKGQVDPDYLVKVNKKAMLESDIILFYINDSKTCGVWMETIWAMQNKKNCIFYAEPGVKISLYMRWVAQACDSLWINEPQMLAHALNREIINIDSKKGVLLLEDGKGGCDFHLCGSCSHE